MQRFEPGEQVLVRHFMGSSCEPPKCGVVRQVYGSRSLLYDYLVQVGTSGCWPVRDEWLAPDTITITEDLEWTDVTMDLVQVAQVDSGGTGPL